MVALAGRGWRLAPSLEAMWEEANRIAPDRSRASDGSIGDQAHANRSSRHNPYGGFVHALDLTHDPDGGFDAHARARTVASGRDPRCRLIISNARTWSRARASEGWRPYGGPNPHRTHAHFEVETTDSARNDRSPWFAAVPPFPTKPIPPPHIPPAESALLPEEGPVFLIIDNVGFLAVVDGVPVSLTMQQYAEAHDKSKNVQVLHLSEDVGRVLFGHLMRKFAAAVEG